MVTASLASGCASFTKITPPPQTPLMKALQVKATATEVRVAVSQLAIRVPGTIEASADAIMSFLGQQVAA